MKPSEELAKKIMEKVLSGIKVIPVDNGTQNSVHNFDLRNEGEETPFAAVEVTSTVDSDFKKLKAILSKNRTINVKRLRKFWHLYLTEDFINLKSIKRQWPKFEDYLLPIEKIGRKNFFSPSDFVDNQAIEKIWKDLKVEAGYSHRAQEPKIILTDAGGGGKMCHSYIQDAVKKEAFKTDNRTKLQKATDCERHLLIIVDCETDYLTWRAMLDGYCPPDIPNLPPEIDIVWLATCAPNNSYLIWRVSSANGWKILGEIDIGQKL